MIIKSILSTEETVLCDLDATGKSRESQQGRVYDIGLNIEKYGWIQLEGAGRKIYQAAPLIDRNKDYSANFKIEIL